MEANKATTARRAILVKILLEATDEERELVLKSFEEITAKQLDQRRASIAHAQNIRLSRMRETNNKKTSRSCDSLTRTAPTVHVSHSPFAKDCEHDSTNRIGNLVGSHE